MIAASICAAAYVDKTVGCRSPAPFVRPEQKPDGKFIRHQGDPSEFCAIERVYKGSFTRAGARQAVVSFGACVKPGEMYTAVLPGSAVLVEEVSGRWVEVDVQSDTNADKCLQARRADGREVLLCRSRVGALVTGEIDYFFMLDFVRKSKGKGAAGTLAVLFGDLPACGQDPQRKLGLTMFDGVEMKVSDLNHDGTDDLVVKVKRSHAPDSPALTAGIRKQCERAESGTVDRVPLLKQGAIATLEFLSEGDKFTPSTATRRLLDTWSRQYPEHLNLLDASAPPPLD